MAVVVNAAGMALAVYALVVAAAWLGQRHLMYVPDRTRVAPATVGLTDAREVILDAPDGARLVAWTSPAAPGRPTMLYLHGNAGNIAGRANRYARYRAHGFGILMLSWRGYGGSTGSPTEADNVADALRAYDWLRAAGVKPGDIVLYGESLGSGVAVQVAAERPVRAVVLDSPYTSITDVALLTYPYLPVRPLLSDRYESDRHIARVKAPIMIVHGERDAVIPVRMGRELFAKASEPKRLEIFPEGGHVDLDEYGAADRIVAWGEAFARR